MFDFGHRICNCVRTDCENCPMKYTGTAGASYERAFLQGQFSDSKINITIKNDENGKMVEVKWKWSELH